jgi:ATPase subunit of ABC transporter with duplicated ATPase domains
MIEANVARDDVLKALRGINFTEQMLQSPRGSLSGGWKMKVLT